MRFSIDVGSELELKLYQAVLLYRNDHGNRVMATVHGVVQKEADGTPLLGAGQLLSTAALRELTRQLGTSCPAEVPARTRRSSNSRVDRVVDACRQCGPCSSVRDLNLPMFPASCFRIQRCCSSCGTEFCLCVRSQRAKGHGPDTKLAAAPYWNIDSNGAVCAGTMRTPKSLHVASIAAWQQAFFQSEFTHPGGAGRLTKRKGGTAALWKSLAGKKTFPRSTLIETEPLHEYLRKLEAAQR